MILEPNIIKPGYLKRWASEASTMLGINFHIWFVLMLALSSMSVVFSNTIFSIIFFVALGYYAMNLSLELAVTAEHSKVRVSQIPLMAYQALKGTIEELWHQRIALAIVIVLATGLLLYLALHPAVAKASTSPLPVEDIFYWLFDSRSPLMNAAAMLFVGINGVRRNMMLGYMTYPLQRMHGLTYEAAVAMIEKAERKNTKAALGLDSALCLVVAGVVLFAPGFAPLFFCFLPALCYAACRELFGPGAPPEPVRQSVSAGATAGSSA